ncbi:MAG: anti-sigma factor domain-containing protein [Clostridia bacterium]|nr:anti-sigma factor domain-containing protein [Clostridia bacterium]
MYIKGSVFAVEEDVVIVLTEASDFVVLKKKPGLTLGQEIEFQKSDIVKPSRNKTGLIPWVSVIGAIAALFIISLLYLHFSVHDAVYAYIDVDINPSFEIEINAEDKVLEAKALNEEAQILLQESGIKLKPLKEALAEIVKRSKEHHFITSGNENVILISGSLNENHKEYRNTKGKDEKLKGLLISVKESIEKLQEEHIKPKVVKISPEKRKLAIQHEVSMGKYYVFEKAKEQGVGVTLEEIKKSDMAGIVKKVDVKDFLQIENFSEWNHYVEVEVYGE